MAITRAVLGEDALKEWGWRIPFLLSICLLAISVWIRLQLEESPAFQKLKDEGKTTKAAYSESFLRWRNLKIVLLAFFTVCMAQGVVWYTGSFYTQFFLERTLKIDSLTVNLLMIAAVALSAPLYIFFAWLSDKIGRKPVMLFGIVLMLFLYFPGYHFITQQGNPELARASEEVPVTVIADPADCTFQLDLTGGARQFSTSCDIAKGALTSAGVSYSTEAGPAGALARIRIGSAEVESISAVGQSNSEIRATRTAFETEVLRPALNEAGYPAHAPGAMQLELAEIARVFSEKGGVYLMMALFVVAATALYGPQAAALRRALPDAHSLHGAFSAVSHRRWLVRRLAAGDRVRDQHGNRLDLSGALVSGDRHRALGACDVLLPAGNEGPRHSCVVNALNHSERWFSRIH